MRKVFAEIGRYVLREKKYWLVPVLIFLTVLLGFVVLTIKGGAVAPFIYPLF